MGKKAPSKTSAKSNRIRYLWRTKYPWLFVLYILAFGVIIGSLKTTAISLDAALDLLLMTMFTSFVFLFIFYVYGVRPSELEHHFK